MRAVLPWAVAAALGLVAVGLGLAFIRHMPAARAAERESRFELRVPEGQRLGLVDVPNVAISPDGRRVAIQVEDDTSGESSIALRPLDRLDATRVEGTDGATAPFFSPDGAWLGFFVHGRLAKVPVQGGVPTVLSSDAPQPRGGSWGPDGTIVYSPGFDTGLLAISAAGGAARRLAAPDATKGERTYRWPQVLPDGKAVLFTIGWLSSPQDYDNADIAAYSFATRSVTTLVKGGSMARFVPPNTLVYSRAGTLYAVPLDLSAMSVAGDPAPVLDGVGGEPTSGAAYFAAAADGTLAWIPGVMSSPRTYLVLVDRAGRVTRLPLPAARYHTPRFSPDGGRLAFTSGQGRGGLEGDIWIADLRGNGLTRLTFDGQRAFPVWAPGGDQIAYCKIAGADQGLYRRAADGNGTETAIGERPLVTGNATSWGGDGRSIAYTVVGVTIDLWILDVATGKARSFEPGAASGAISPSGPWVAYEAGDAPHNIFVRRLEGTAKWQISPNGGSYPRWSAGGRAIFYIHNGEMMQVNVDGGALPRFGPPEPLFGGLDRFMYRGITAVNYDVSADGKRFAFVEYENPGSVTGRVVVAVHWAAAIRESGPQRAAP